MWSRYQIKGSLSQLVLLVIKEMFGRWLWVPYYLACGKVFLIAGCMWVILLWLYKKNSAFNLKCYAYILKYTFDQCHFLKQSKNTSKSYQKIIFRCSSYSTGSDREFALFSQFYSDQSKRLCLKSVLCLNLWNKSIDN